MSLPQLECNEKGVPYVSERNWRILFAQDPILSTLQFNMRAGLPEWSAELPPWRAAVGDPTLRNADLGGIRAYLEIEGDFRAGSLRNVSEHVSFYAERKAFDPVKDYLDGLPAWDGVERAEACLPGMPDDPDGRRCLHLGLTGAVKRVYEPGCKFDHMVILVGDQGVGKTLSVNRLFRGWVTSLGRFGNKDDEIRYTTAWCVMDDERVASLAAGSRGAELYKDWLSQTEYRGRRPFKEVTERMPRAYVAWGATNDPSFLRSQEGNRRYLPIRLGESTAGELQRLLDPKYVAQIWAEVKVWYERGDRTYIDRDTELPAHERYLSAFLDESDDDTLSRLRKLLSTPVPSEWNEWSLAQQCDWWQSREEAGSLSGGVAAVRSADERPSVGDPPTRYVSREGAGLQDRVFLKQLLVLLEPGLPASQVASVQLMLARELRRLGWVRKSIRVSGVVRKGYRPGCHWAEYVAEQKEAGLL